jgi:hypothetical protein
MNKKINLFFAVFIMACSISFAGNPDRQGSAGAYELLINPWARTVGLHAMNTASVQGAEAMGLNVAGLSRMKNFEVAVGHSIYLSGTDLRMNALAIGARISENGVLGIGVNALGFGEIPVTTTGLPEGTGATFSPNFFNLGISYAHYFDKKVSVGFTARLINETLNDVSATGFSFDAGVQYITGSKEYPERFKFGLNLRNVGGSMRFTGQGLNVSVPNIDGSDVPITAAKVGAGFELPTQFNIGAAYDLLPKETAKLTGIINFTSNAFSRDDIGGALEFSYKSYFQIRGGYRHEIGVVQGDPNRSVYTGLCGGVSVQIPLSKVEGRNLAIDYGYMPTRFWNGTHNISLRINL